MNDDNKIMNDPKLFFESFVNKFLGLVPETYLLLQGLLADLGGLIKLQPSMFCF